MTADLAWLVLFIVAWAVVLLVVPRDRVSGLLLPSFLGGTVLALIVNLIAVPILGLWRFPATVAAILGVPIFMLLAYMAEMLLFLHYWDHLPGGSAEKGLYMVVFSMLTTVLGYIALVMGYLTFVNWNLAYFFLVSFVVHALVALLYTAPGIRQTLRRV